MTACRKLTVALSFGERCADTLGRLLLMDESELTRLYAPLR